MFHLILVVAFLAGPPDAAAQPAQDPTVARVQDEILALARALNEAALKQDRAALERIFAPEFVFVHAYGYVDDRATQITQLLERRADAPLRVPTFDPPNELLIYGDVAVLRRPKSTTDDGSPAWGTTIYAKREGRYQMVQAQGTEMQRDRKWTTLGAAILETYVGRYAGSSGQTYTIRREGDGLRIGGLLLKPISETVFFDKAGGEWTFHRGVDGKVTGFLRRFRGREDRLNKVD